MSENNTMGPLVFRPLPAADTQIRATYGFDQCAADRAGTFVGAPAHAFQKVDLILTQRHFHAISLTFDATKGGGFTTPADRSRQNTEPPIGWHPVPREARQVTPYVIDTTAGGGRVTPGGRYIRRWLAFEDDSMRVLLLFPNYGWSLQHHLQPWAEACGLVLNPEVPAVHNRSETKVIANYWKTPVADIGCPVTIPRPANLILGPRYDLGEQEIIE